MGEPDLGPLASSRAARLNQPTTLRARAARDHGAKRSAHGAKRSDHGAKRAAGASRLRYALNAFVVAIQTANLAVASNHLSEHTFIIVIINN